MKKGIILLLLFIGTLSFGQTDKIEEAIMKETNADGSFNYKYDIKVLPNDPSKSIAAVSKSDDDDDEGIYDTDLILLLIDNASQKILAKLIEKDRFSSDAVMLTGIELDLANYSVADGVTAFGIRDSYETQSQPNPYASHNLSLYIIKGDTFQPLLEGFQTYIFRGETDMKCYFDGIEADSVLIMQKNKTNGYYDIKVRTDITALKTRNPKKKDDDCINLDKKLKPAYRTLQFSKGQYRLKKKKT